MWISLPDLADVLGRDMAGVLCRVLGGVEVYVPHTPGQAHELARIVGPGGMLALCAEFGGQSITVPNGKRQPHKERVSRLLQQGRSKRDIALECGVTERYVYYVAGLGPRQEQLTLPYTRDIQ